MTDPTAATDDVTGDGRTAAGGYTVVIPPGCRQRIRNAGQADLLFLAICTPRFVPQSYQDAEDA